MNAQAMPILPHQQALVDRFVAACHADDRIIAAFLSGSYAKGIPDAYSDVDLGLITTDEAFEDFRSGREAFIRLLGAPVLLEDFDLPTNIFFIFADGTEGELAIGRESAFTQNRGGAFHNLLGKKGVLPGAALPLP